VVVGGRTIYNARFADARLHVTETPKAIQPAAAADWTRLLLLAFLWGGSFIFVGVAVKELPALLIVFVRVLLAAAVLIPVHLIVLGPLPQTSKIWFAAAGMSLMNNVIPFSLIVYGQHFISAGLASVINATTPFFAVAVLAIAGQDKLTGLKVAGLILGLIGVMVLKGVGFADLNQETIGILCVLVASFFYGVSTLWSKLRLTGFPPLTIATCQLIVSSAIMAVLAFTFSTPALLLETSTQAWMAMTALAVFSTALAYLIFFRIIASAGPSFVSLVTMIIPVPAIIMAALFLGETLTLREAIGATIIGAALLVIDGRFFRTKAAR
jgi:drug/metabolite transporter (DMT)-like permease